jgi:hypothetical protein
MKWFGRRWKPEEIGSAKWHRARVKYERRVWPNMGKPWTAKEGRTLKKAVRTILSGLSGKTPTTLPTPKRVGFKKARALTRRFGRTWCAMTTRYCILMTCERMAR